MPVYLVDTIVSFRHKYLVEARELTHAFDEVCMNDCDLVELTQRSLGETICDGREVTQEEIIKIVQQLQVDKDESCSYWLGDQLINKIDYQDT